MDWAIHHCHGPVGELHAMTPPSDRRSVWTMTGDDDALVLGSAQAPAVADPEACVEAGVSVVTRRSGGGAVLLRTGEYRWLDVVVPAGDPLWDDDVTRSFGWIGQRWLDALGAVGHHGRRHQGATRFRDEGRVACFAGWSPGEILSVDRKVIGMSQRRTRHYARFQCVFYARYDPADLLGLLDTSLRADRLRRRLERVEVVGEPDAVVDAFIASLP